ncbi:hypothetical protein M0R45_025904 [Rubus argutus]|uniref:Uncharacterized protein n=1 Tax=Rubus argutus TaxID=59490 RepID=A0AAW1WYA5_RUBAR
MAPLHLKPTRPILIHLTNSNYLQFSNPKTTQPPHRTQDHKLLLLQAAAAALFLSPLLFSHHSCTTAPPYRAAFTVSNPHLTAAAFNQFRR